MASSKRGVQITVHDFHLNESDECRYDSLFIYADDDQVAQLCGRQGKNQTYHAVQGITIIFRIDNANERSGLTVSFKNGNDLPQRKFDRLSFYLLSFIS